MNKILKTIWYNLILVHAFFLGFKGTYAGLLTGDTRDEVNELAGDFAGASGFDRDADLANVVSTVISAFLGLLGIIFVVLVILAGYNWMTAAGDEQKVTKAKDTLRRAVIGIIITIGAYAITYFVFSHLPGDASGGGLGTSPVP